MKNSYKVIGLMSGTSLDGLDIAYCTFQFDDKWKFSIKEAITIEYDDFLRSKLKNSINLSGLELLLFHNEYGRWLGKQTKKFVDKYQLDVDFIASHGHTVFHQIDKNFTYQLGNGQELANHSGSTTIADFRSLDVSLGGQGAPLVPIGDMLIFPEYDFALNLGGIVNVSFQYEGKRLAFDVAPINMLLNHIIAEIDKPYDDGGQLAHSGTLNQSLLEELNALSFYKEPFPKSLGYEWFCEEVLPIIDRSNLRIEDKLHTSVHHIAKQVAEALLPYAKDRARLLTTGGGAKNNFFIETLKKYLGKKVEVELPSKIIIDFKEAMVFAFMGVLKMRGEINCLSSVTGAISDTSSGQVYKPY